MDRQPLKSGRTLALTKFATFMFTLLKRRCSTKGAFSMKNVFKVLGIIAIAAVIGFSTVSCSSDHGGGGGALTITGLTEAEGKYVVGYGEGDFMYYFAGKDTDEHGEQIKNGKVTLKVYSGMGSWNEYNGDATVTFFLYFLDSATDKADSNGSYDGKVTVTFAEGVGSGVAEVR